jgi:hypothetical protein
VFTPPASLPSVWPLQSNNIVNTKAVYDILFRTGSTGVVKTIELIFPTGTNIVGGVLLEESGVGPGLLSISGQKLTYSVIGPVSIPSGTTIRLEVGNINNPLLTGTSLAVQVTTKDAVGNVIDSGTSAVYSIKQLGTGDITDNAITSTKIQDGQVGTSDIANSAISASKIASGAVKPVMRHVGAVTQYVNPGVTGSMNVFCDPNEVATGGGFSTDSPKLVVTHSTRTVG